MANVCKFCIFIFYFIVHISNNILRVMKSKCYEFYDTTLFYCDFNVYESSAAILQGTCR